MYTHMAKLLRVLSIIILILTSIAITFDSGIFVYPSLSNTLFFSILVSLLTLITAFYAIHNTSYEKVSIYSCIVFFWGVYILLHCYHTNGEYYRSLYLISSIIYLITLSFLIRIQIINITFIKKKHSSLYCNYPVGIYARTIFKHY